MNNLKSLLIHLLMLRVSTQVQFVLFHFVCENRLLKGAVFAFPVILTIFANNYSK